MTDTEKLIDSFPPIACRLCARSKDGKKRLTRKEIIRRSGLSGPTIDRLSVAGIWGHTSKRVMFAYAEACRVDFLKLRRHKEYLKRRHHVAWKSRPDIYGRLLAKLNSI